MGEKIITPIATLSYPYLFSPVKNEQGDEYYSCALVFDESADIQPLMAAAIEAGAGKFGPKFTEGVKAGKFSMPFRTDVEEKGYPAGSTFINVRSKYKPGVVDRFAGPDGKPMKIDGDEAAKVYAGALVRASLRAFAYDKAGKRGVSFGLLNIQKLGEGPRLDGRMAASEEFEATEKMEAVPFENQF